ncbi:hypothetical protein COO60DRAFT_1474800 [Scenedesmus sp. NREL 46B-D3]|nr:hypothetical protein COO60DRAFT_1474800 [Scenedesmus sp. NREL 46B-D3]
MHSCRPPPPPPAAAAAAVQAAAAAVPNTSRCYWWLFAAMKIAAIQTAQMPQCCMQLRCRRVVARQLYWHNRHQLGVWRGLGEGCRAIVLPLGHTCHRKAASCKQGYQRNSTCCSYQLGCSPPSIYSFQLGWQLLQQPRPQHLQWVFVGSSIRWDCTSPWYTTVIIM